MKTIDTQRVIEAVDALKENRLIYSNADLARMIKKQTGYLSECLNGKRKISERFIQSLCSAFPELNPLWLTNGTKPIIRGSYSVINGNNNSPNSKVGNISNGDAYRITN